MCAEVKNLEPSYTDGKNNEAQVAPQRLNKVVPFNKVELLSQQLEFWGKT